MKMSNRTNLNFVESELYKNASTKMLLNLLLIILGLKYRSILENIDRFSYHLYSFLRD